MKTGLVKNNTNNSGLQNINTVLILGPPRTGTTLLGYLLAGGKHVQYFSEPFIFPKNRKIIKQIIRLRLRKKFNLTPPKNDGMQSLLQYFKNVATNYHCEHLLIKETYRMNFVLPNSQEIEQIISKFDSSIAVVRHPYNAAYSTIQNLRYWHGISGTFLLLINPEIYKFKDDTEILEWFCENWIEK